MALGRMVLRLTVGGLMAGHGLQKLRGSFGGPGLEGTERSMRSLGLYPPRQQALAVALSETVGGALTAAGLFSPLGPAMITGSQAVAMKKVHLRNGPWITKGGFEYNLTLVAAAFCLAADGPGALSLDALFGKKRSGLHWGLFQVLLGGAAAAATLKISEKMRPADEVLSTATEAGSGAAPTSTAKPSSSATKEDEEPVEQAADKPAAESA